jgi:hypothetical protein
VDSRLYEQRFQEGVKKCLKGIMWTAGEGEEVPPGEMEPVLRG